jgi:PncC family amidohydrolase
MNELVDLLKHNGLTLSTVESFTGGLFGARLSEIPGVSEVYRGTLTAYTAGVKSDWLDLDPNWLQSVGTISADCAKAMAIRGRLQFHSNVCVAMTGNAGPTALEGQSVGQWYACIALGERLIEIARIDHMERNTLRHHAVDTVAAILTEALREVDSTRIHP